MRTSLRWIAVAVSAVLIAGGVVWASTPRTPECGPAGVAALTDATDRLHQALPQLVVDPATHAGDCGMDGTTFGFWSYPGLQQLEADGRVAGCTIGDLGKWEDEPLLSCPVPGAVVFLSVDSSDGGEVSGTVALR